MLLVSIPKKISVSIGMIYEGFKGKKSLNEFSGGDENMRPHITAILFTFIFHRAVEIFLKDSISICADDISFSFPCRF